MMDLTVFALLVCFWSNHAASETVQKRIQLNENQNDGIQDRNTECTSAQEDLGCCVEKVFVSTSGEELEWKLTDNGAGGVWNGSTSSIQFDIADSTQCGGNAYIIQYGAAVMEFNLDKEETIILSMEGKAEPAYEMFLLYIDGILKSYVQASSGSTCSSYSCNMCTVQMAEKEFTFAAGPHQIYIIVDTKDGLWHKDAYFRVDFAIKVNDQCEDCVCAEKETIEVDVCDSHNGVSNNGRTFCCAKSCGTCGGPGCAKRDGGRKSCCQGAILRKNETCDDVPPLTTSAPCVL